MTAAKGKQANHPELSLFAFTVYFVQASPGMYIMQIYLQHGNVLHQQPFLAACKENSTCITDSDIPHNKDFPSVTQSAVCCALVS